MKTKKSPIDTLCGIAIQQGFDQYGSFNEGEEQHDIYLCNKGARYDGEVIDIYWLPGSGEVTRVEYSTQSKNQKSNFDFQRFWDCSGVNLNAKRLN